MEQGDKIKEINRPLVSICCLVYNHELYLKESLDSFLMQKMTFPFEIVIHDDASTDSSASIIKEYASKYPEIFKPLYQTENQKSRVKSGMNPRFNFPRAKGKYIALCEGDDYWTDPLKLQKQVDFLEKNNNNVLCYHPVDILKEDGTIVNDFITTQPEDYEKIETLARLGNYIHTPSVVFRNIIKTFPAEFKHTPFGDSFIYMLLAEHGKLGYLSDVMAVYRYGVGVYSSKTKLVRMKKELIRLSCLLSYFKNKNINEILLDRFIDTINNYHALIESEFGNQNVIEPSFRGKIIKYLKRNYHRPEKILRKIYSKLLN